MLILMKADAPPDQVNAVMEKVREHGFRPLELPGQERTAIGVLGSNPIQLRDLVLSLPGVADAVPVSKPFKLVSREFHPQSSVVTVRDRSFGPPHFQVIAGPCSVESEAQLMAAAEAVKAAGATLLRGGAFKPRTSPYSFRGLGEAGLELLAKARDALGLPIVTEVLTTEEVPLVAGYADLLQVGARNCQNFGLLEAVGRTRKPILLKRGMSNTIEEWLLSAEYIVGQGNDDVILCERGIRTFEGFTRNTLDLGAVPVVKELSHLPVIVDPSHGSGHWWMVPPLARAAAAVGADGLLIEVHPAPDEALSDGAQSLNPVKFQHLMRELAPLLDTLGIRLG
ncbi:MAG: 3-deoxy-7-phosphoheptulonate synthase [Chloroflexi bacterium]|nr:MAG: 3-deoxy-7-phosphoheptulonate synthase [Chloroflexota bacterium]